MFGGLLQKTERPPMNKQILISAAKLKNALPEGFSWVLRFDDGYYVLSVCDGPSTVSKSDPCNSIEEAVDNVLTTIKDYANRTGRYTHC